MRRLTWKCHAEEFDRLMTTSTYKGKDIFVATAGSEYFQGGRDAEMTFGIGTIDYSALYDGDDLRTIALGPNSGADDTGLRHLPSDAAADLQLTELVGGETYIITSLGTSDGAAGDATIDNIIANSDLDAATDLQSVWSLP